MLREALHQTRLSPRFYQKEALQEFISFTGSRIRQIDTSGRGHFENACLLEMATGSGKTFTVGIYLEKIFSFRDRYRFLRELYPNLSIVLLSDRIDGVNQFRDDLLHGRSGEKPKSPILLPLTIEKLKVSTYHSRLDGDDLNLRGEGEIDVENPDGLDEIIFSTYQTAYVKELVKRLSHVDIVIIDEAHNVRPNTNFFHLIEQLSRLGRGGYSPIILPITATPTNTTKELFGDPKYHFGVGEYLASGFSPKVEYHIVTSFHVDEGSIRHLVDTIRRAKDSIDIDEKEEFVREARDIFQGLMARDVSVERFAGDVVDRLSIVKDGVKQLEETIIFASSIYDADNIAEALRAQIGVAGSALAYHSRNDNNNALDRLTDQADPCRIIVAVDKLNESIDLPVVSNIVFYRYTEDAKIYLQQFGRGLRGDGTVRYYDYIGGMSNFSWIGSIQEKYIAAIKSQRNPRSPVSLDIPSQTLTIDETQQGTSTGIFWSDPVFQSFPIGDIGQHDISNVGDLSQAIESFQDSGATRINQEDIGSTSTNKGFSEMRAPLVYGPHSVPSSEDDDIVFASEEILSDLGDIGKSLGSEHKINFADLGLFIMKLGKEVEISRNISIEQVIIFLRSIRNGTGIEQYRELSLMVMRKVRELDIGGIKFSQIPSMKKYVSGNKSHWNDFLERYVFPNEIREEKDKKQQYIISEGKKLQNFFVKKSQIRGLYYEQSLYNKDLWYAKIPGLSKDIAFYMDILGYPLNNEYILKIPEEIVLQFIEWIKAEKYHHQ